MNDNKEMVEDSTRFRVTLICKCAQDYAEGYGSTPEAARKTAYKWFRKDHGSRSKPQEEYLEVAVVHNEHGGSHFEPFGR